MDKLQSKHTGKMATSIDYAMMRAGDISIRGPENILCCLELNTSRFGTGHVYFRVFAVTSPSRSYRFDQVSETYSDRKVMKYLVDVEGQGELKSHTSPGVESPILVYAWKQDYDKIVGHNQHHGYNFVVLPNPSGEVYSEHGKLTHEDMKMFYGG